MIYNVYSIRNDISGLHDGLFLFTCDQHASYELSRRIKPDQFAVTSVYCVGTFDVERGILRAIEEDDDAPFAPLHKVELVDLSNVDSLARKSEISHEAPEIQHSKFVEKTSDIR